MKLEYILLGALLEHPSTGYDLKGYMNTHGRFLRSNTQMSQVYRTLTAMQGRGWVTYDIEPRPGAQDAKTYRVTSEGINVFLDWIAGPYTPPSRLGDPDLSVRLAFAGFMTIGQLLRLIDTEITTRESEIRRFRHRDRSISWDSPIAVDHELFEMVDEWGHAQGSAAMDMHLDTMRELRRKVEELAYARKNRTLVADVADMSG